ncbi:MAG: hypothetical protein ACJASY_003859, partial [Halioglobus sp.]
DHPIPASSQAHTAFSTSSELEVHSQQIQSVNS